MHEISLVENLLRILDKLCCEHSVKSFTKINIRVNPYSCADEDNLNFIFGAMVKDDARYKHARIEITRGNDPASREFIIDDIEIETMD